MIPKIIHYCWFGGNPLPPLLEHCRASWMELLPGYRFIKWDESNTSFDTPWIRRAMKEKKYAFVSDYIRFKVLHEYGGIYLDTDMYLIQNLDPLLGHSAFFGFQDDKKVNMAIVGSEKNHLLIQLFMECYSSDNESLEVITSKIEPILTSYFGVLQVDQINHKDGIYIYPKSYFYPVPYSIKVVLEDVAKFKGDHTYAAHLWFKSWYDEFTYFSVQEYQKGFELVWEKLQKSPIQPWKYYKFLGYSLLVNLKKSINKIIQRND